MQTAEDGRPLWIQLRRRRLRVTGISEVWQINDGWWRAEISRCYCRLLLEDGRQVTVFQDLLTRRWFQQHY